MKRQLVTFYNTDLLKIIVNLYNLYIEKKNQYNDWFLIYDQKAHLKREIDILRDNRLVGRFLKLIGIHLYPTRY